MECEESASANVNSADSLPNSEAVQVRVSDILTVDNSRMALKRLRRKSLCKLKRKNACHVCSSSPIRVYTIEFVEERLDLAVDHLCPNFYRKMTTIPEEGFHYKKPSKHHYCSKAKAAKKKVASLKAVVNRLKKMWPTKPEVLQECLTDDILEHFRAIQI
ncbi:uncharacterized protein LOC118200368 [Stegodyphus dumicola]|uniref:uncharacterized protein LOC118200368 n=1 Tax=Stegodyphus dumicola TaxID=202533 RepID=UPI0015A80467|nr:uncharacterized protein LOC118200368 [Stegodyphus dumicola]